MFKKMVALFLLVMLAGQVSIAEESKYEFTSLNRGDESPYFGYLLKPETLVKIYTEVEEKEKRSKLECNAKLANINLDLNKLSETKDIEKQILIKTYEELLTGRREQLLAQQNKINNLNSTILADKFFIAGSFLAGIIITTSVIYFTASLPK
jgi:hypothetical protein